jgi:hypothetical protein
MKYLLVFCWMSWRHWKCNVYWQGWWNRLMIMCFKKCVQKNIKYVINHAVGLIILNHVCILIRVIISIYWYIDDVEYACV